MRGLWPAISLFVALILISGMGGGPCGCTGCTLGDTIRTLGFVPVAQPSTLYKPGGVFNVTNDGSKDNFTAVLVCSAAEYAGSPTASVDEGASTTASSKLSLTFDATANYKDQLSGKVDLSAVRSITLKLNNVKVESISAGQVFSGLKDQRQGCASAIKNYQTNPSLYLGVMLQALKADAVYTIEFNTGVNLSVTATKDIANGVAAAIAGGATVGADNSISGNGLYFGVVPPDRSVVKVATAKALRSLYTPYTVTENRNSIPCANRTPCSPDGKWLAAETRLNLSSSASGRTLSDPKIECDDSGTGACVFHTSPLFETTADQSMILARVYTFSIPVKVRLKATEWGAS
jgi:hypothetical protein